MHTVSFRLFPVTAALALGLLFSSAAPGANKPQHSVNQHHNLQTVKHHQTASHASHEGEKSGKAGAQSRPGNNRSLNLYKVHTLKHFKVVFWTNGHYVPRAMHKLDYFLRDEHNNRQRRMDPRLIMLLWRIQQKAGDRPIGIVSAYRSPTTNHELREETDEVAKHSMHPLGRAADIRISGMTEPQVFRLAKSMHAGGVGYYTKNKFVHVDTGRIRYWNGH